MITIVTCPKVYKFLMGLSTRHVDLFVRNLLCLLTNMQMLTWEREGEAKNKT